MEQFVVEIERTEKYYTKVLVKAENEQEARRKAVEFDIGNGLEDTWNELQPSVSTDYTATPEALACITDGEKEFLTVVE